MSVTATLTSNSGRSEDSAGIRCTACHGAAPSASRTTPDTCHVGANATRTSTSSRTSPALTVTISAELIVGADGWNAVGYIIHGFPAAGAAIDGVSAPYKA